MILRLTFISLLITSSITAAPQKAADDDGNFKLIILHNNDMHARFEQTSVMSGKCKKEEADTDKCYGGFARVAHEVREFRRKAEAGEIPEVLYLNAGDTYTGTPWFSLYKDEIASDFLKILKPDAISLGNHEFDEGSANLGKFLDEVDFPVLASNLDLTNEPVLVKENLKPSMIIDAKDGRKIGIIGYLTPETKEVAIPNNVEFIDEVVAINKEATALKELGVNIIIALGHSGLERDKQIADQCPDIDLIIGGHSHTFLYTGQAPDWERPADNYPVVVTQKSGKKVPVVQAYAYTKYLGYIHLEFDDEGNLLQITGKPILLDKSIPRDDDVLQLLEKYRPGIIDMENEIVGQTKVFLDGSCRRRECNLGNFIADAMVDWYSLNYESADYWTDASIGIIQGGGVRASIDHKFNDGAISKEDAATVMPFESKMVVVEITGKALLEALEHSVHRYHDGEERGEFLQFSGVQVTYDMNHPVGQRVVDAKVLCADCQIPELRNIDETKLYKIVMQDFLADGGDGYEMFKDKTVLATNKIDLDVFLEYLKKKSPVHPAVEWRITIKSMLVETDSVGSTRVLLDSNCRQSECNLGNFITDSMVDWYALKYDGNEFWTDASIAIIQGSRIKASINPNTNNGVITKADAERIFQPAFNNLNVISLTGDELIKLLEHSISTHSVTNNLEFLQMSGIQVVFDLNKPIGQQVVEVQVLCAMCSVPELRPLVRTQEYKIIMQSILATGGDSFGAVLSGKSPVDLQESDINVFLEYLKKKSPVHPSVEWRITIKPFVDVVGSTRVLLDSNCQHSECNLGNFITDAMVDWHALKYNENEFWTDASIAIIQGSKIKSSIDPKVNEGFITRSAAETIFESFEKISLISLSGFELKNVLEHSISQHGSSESAEFLQMSGLQVVYNVNRPVGQRVTEVKVLCAQCNVPELQLLQTSQQYNVIMQSSLAMGADGYDNAIGTKVLTDLDETEVNVFIEYLRKKSPVHPAVEWRITIIDEAETTIEMTQESTAGTTPSIAPTISSTPDSANESTTESGSNFKVSFILILMTTILSFVIKK